MHRHSTPGDRRLSGGLRILFEDEDMLVVDKPSGLLSVPTPLEGGRSALEVLEDYVRKGQAKSRKRIFAVNRLDRFTSGVLLFAKSMDMRERLHVDWTGDTRKTYLAVVRGRMAEPSGRIESYLSEDDRMLVHSTRDPAQGKPAVTEWQVLRATPTLSLLEINLLTGRKNQIRVHMAGLGHPVVGDRKYGGAGKGSERLALHAWKIAFRHPRNGRILDFTAPIPKEIDRMVPATERATDSDSRTSDKVD